jgi:hypothetical protein
MNQAQNKMVYALFNKTGLINQKESIVSGFSNGRTASTRELSHEESVAMIRWLKEQDKDDPSAQKMRGKIMYYAHEMGWTKKNKLDKVVADGKRIDEWMLQYSYLKKKLNSYNLKELPKLVSQFQAYYAWYISKL